MTWSFQLYSARNFQPWDKVLETLKMIGYKNVEGFGGMYDTPGADALWDMLDKNGLAMPSGHFSLDQLKDSNTGLRTAKTLRMKLVACPHIAADRRPNDAAGWRDFGKMLAEVGKPYRDEGYDFAWHNHDFEFQPLGDGSVPMTHILDAAPELGWEMDVAWVIRGGADPKPWIEKYGSRILAVHVKDIAPKGQNTDEDGWADVGHGTVDWKGLCQLLRDKSAAKYFVMEHDNPSDATRFARLSFAAAQRF
ncbi:sugar phosphate isomerase/epimerase family protein [Arvimicrobium flavum]|uniref:sugar phosphate isomerase/epimerase family protein n=1 Tax=Arvimicrobium flavum TaxID=3393320 RepID=UPI00237BFEAD|nr:sugar phosphate isomerase/epimerase [Mesorhizobium shangrilense]